MASSVKDFMPPIGFDGPHKHVRGWLLALCLMLTVFGPLISGWLMSREYEAFAPDFARSPGVHVAIWASLVVGACSVAVGVYAGLRLWLVRPGAVGIAKKALLFGLAADIFTTVVDVAARSSASTDQRFLHEVTLRLIPSLLFFTVSFAYLNRSKRVHATYR